MDEDTMRLPNEIAWAYAVLARSDARAIELAFAQAVLKAWHKAREHKAQVDGVTL